MREGSARCKRSTGWNVARRASPVESIVNQKRVTRGVYTGGVSSSVDNELQP